MIPLAFAEWVRRLNDAAWGPVMLVLLTGTGAFLTLRTGFLPWRNLPYGFRCLLRRPEGGTGDVSPFSALMTTLAATIGTGNIAGVATALTAGGPGALVWMELSALLGISSKFAECMLAVKYRTVNRRGEMAGGPIYVMARALRPRLLGRALAGLFALFTVLASFGVGNMTQSHSMADALWDVFGLAPEKVGAVTAALVVLVILGGIRSISRVASVVVPVMAALYLAAGLAVLVCRWGALPGAVAEMFRLAFSPAAAAGGVAGQTVSCLLRSARYGIARGCFSNEAGMGSSAVSAAAAITDHPVRQGYIHMTGVVLDTTVICTLTGLVICCSGALGHTGADGAALTILCFRSVLGESGAVLVAVSIALFAFATLLGWEYIGEKAAEYLLGTAACPVYRAVFAAVVFLGATQELELVWGLSDVFNALMALPNLLCLLLLSGEAARDARGFQPTVDSERRRAEILTKR